MKKGLLLLNLGTPDDTSNSGVRRYLAEFLMDPYVIDIHPVLKFALVYGAILPTRPAKSARAYRKIWTDRGSPLFFHTDDLAKAVAAKLEPLGVAVEFAMRYANPSVRSTLEKLRERGVTELTAFPLYPQYSLAATESSIQKIKSEVLKMKWDVKLRFVPAFYDHPDFVTAFAAVIRPLLEQHRPDHVLFSFHGIPERHVKKTDATGAHCLTSSSCCDKIQADNKNCYRAQSYATARRIAQALKIPAAKYGVSFQSRLGRTPWIKPYTDLLYPELAARGVKKLLVVCPSFVADCLETLEEIRIRGREDFRKAGGDELIMVPSLNSTSEWVDAVGKISAFKP